MVTYILVNIGGLNIGRHYVVEVKDFPAEVEVQAENEEQARKKAKEKFQREEVFRDVPDFEPNGVTKKPLY